MAKIVLMFKAKTIKEVQVPGQTMKIGRSADNDIQIDNPSVSRFHAEIYRQGYSYYIEDKNSTNGTLLNGSAVDWKASLKSNDRIQIGKHILVFVEEPGDFGHKRASSYEANETMCVNPNDIKGLK